MCAYLWGRRRNGSRLLIQAVKNVLLSTKTLKCNIKCHQKGGRMGGESENARERFRG
jgi:hypothetical protein